MGLRSHVRSPVARKAWHTPSTALDSWSASTVFLSALNTVAPARKTSRARSASRAKAETGPAAIQSSRPPSAAWLARCSSSHEVSCAAGYW
jgi:hypothetical protein